ncbi:MAG: bifunctional oligoribonuclease/PAP phosphatase NrnA [Bacteroidaceae bacterium]|nr:bifunctional oligoribonuclease/PAP phosphatase NrnA [Bacteroidaceae bacterium]
MLEKIISQENVDAVKQIVGNGNRFVVLAHKNPDGDAVGSTLALCHYLRSVGKEAVVVLPNAFPVFLSWMPAADEVLFYENDKERCDAAIEVADALFCLDFNILSRTGDVCHSLESSSAKKVLIDHHPQPSEEFDVYISHPEACSTCELVFRVITALGGVEALTFEMAQCIYTGMMTDTGAFAYASTRKDVYLIIAELLGKGVDKDWIYRKVFYNFSVTRMRLWGYAMYDKLKVYNKYNAALITLSHSELMRFYASKGDTEGLVNQPLQIKGLRFSCFLREEQPGKINVSLRSVDDFPCNAVAAEFFNGGGHKNASGGEVYGTMEMAVERFRQALQKYKAELTE